ncbi:hypothetical protein MMC18_008042 [Xylographa bjoerkii]|nr:hypothetical protein [Xylographa bjoerkii]
MERRGSLAQRTRRSIRVGWERFRRATASQGLLQYQQQQQQQEQQEREQQHREEEQQEQQRESRRQHRQQQRQAQGFRDESGQEGFDTEDMITRTTRASRKRDTGIQTTQSPSYRDASAQTDRTSTYYDARTQTESKPAYDDTKANAEVDSQGQSNTNEEIDQGVPAVAVDSAVLGVIHSQADQNPGIVAVSTDSTTGLPLLLLTHRLVFVMNQIRSKGQLVEVLEQNTTKSVQELQARRKTISDLEEELGNDDTSDERRAILRQEIAEAEAALKEHRQEMFRIDDDQERENQALKLMREELVTTLERALSDANLLDPLPERIDATEEAQEAANAEQASRGSQASGNTVVSAGELNRQAENGAILDNLEDARIYLLEMEEQFEDRAGMYKRHLDSYTQAVEAGLTSMTMTEFDCNYVQNVSNLTRCLREAEEDYEAALAEARRLKLLPDDDQRSYLASMPSDGYRTSFEAELVGTAPVDFIEKWRELAVGVQDLNPGADGAQTHTDRPEIDSWEAETIRSSESWDAQERERKLEALDRNPNPFYRNRIDRWQENMDELRAEWIKGHSPPESSDDSNK